MAVPREAERLIRRLGMRPHPEEGGWFIETYRSGDRLAADALPERYGAERCCSTAIFYLLTPDTVSAMHRLASDEVFHFYLGDPVQMLHLHPGGTGIKVTLGSDWEKGHKPQVVVPRGTWQGARLAFGDDGPRGYALLGCTVAPGFEFADYEHGDRAALIKSHPEYAREIERLTQG